MSESQTGVTLPFAQNTAIVGGGALVCGLMNAVFNSLRLRRMLIPRIYIPDWRYNSLKRFYCHYGDNDMEQALGPEWSSYARSLPFGTNLRISQRVVEQLRGFQLARKFGLEIVTDRLDARSFTSVLRRHRIDLMLVAGFGLKIPQSARLYLRKDDAPKGKKERAFIFHPSRALPNPTAKLLPQGSEYRGAAIFREVVQPRTLSEPLACARPTARSEREPTLPELQVVMLEVGEDWDSGKIVEVGQCYQPPAFMEHELGPEFEDVRAQSVIDLTATMIGVLCRDRLHRRVFTADQMATCGFERTTLLGMGYTEKEVRNAMERKKRRRQNGD
ncbi:MAG: hypothetical protein U0136_11875 [Bdellovibrionota bacterium]